jgi:N-alpha-acetyltransferase 35, NatC auxiliary subunit
LGLLEAIGLSDFTKLLQEAHEIVEAEATKIKTGQVLYAITARLQFRQKFLEVVSMSAPSSEARVEDLKQCLDLLPKITETMSLGKEMPLAFSTRIQRKLSIQVPPRPIGSIEPKEAATAMKTMLENLIEIEALHNYKSPNELVVLHPSLIS